MRRMKTPLFAMLFLGLCGGWMASCSDDSERGCVPEETRLCAGVGRCQGVQSCLPDSSGWTECDCSSPPRTDGTGGTTGDTPLTAFVGRACTTDAQCGEGLTCFTSSGNDFLGGGAPNGYCTINCNEDAECSAVDRASQCVATIPGSPGLCLRTCRSFVQGPGQDTRAAALQENKCLGRIDLVCQSEAFLGLAEYESLRQQGWCTPQCGSNEDCPGRSCDLARGVCVDTPTAGLAIGERCAGDAECAGGLCVRLGVDEAFCSAPCVYGQPIGCGFGLNATTRGAGCILPQVRGFLSSEGAGDVGLCGELCGSDSECAQQARGWTCELSTDTETLFNRPGLCDAPTPADGGVDAGGGAGGNGGSGGPTSDASTGDAG